MNFNVLLVGSFIMVLTLSWAKIIIYDFNISMPKSIKVYFALILFMEPENNRDIMSNSCKKIKGNCLAFHI